MFCKLLNSVSISDWCNDRMTTANSVSNFFIMLLFLILFNNCNEVTNLKKLSVFLPHFLINKLIDYSHFNSIYARTYC